MTKRVETKLAEMLVEALKQLAIEEDDVDIEYANELRAIAEAIENGTATEGQWIEAIETTIA